MLTSWLTLTVLVVSCLSQCGMAENVTSEEFSKDASDLFIGIAIDMMESIVTQNSETLKAMGVKIDEFDKEVKELGKAAADKVTPDTSRKISELLTKLINQMDSKKFITVLSSEEYRKGVCGKLNEVSLKSEKKTETKKTPELYTYFVKAVDACKSEGLSKTLYNEVLEKVITELKGPFLSYLKKLDVQSDDDEYEFIYEYMMSMYKFDDSSE